MLDRKHRKLMWMGVLALVGAGSVFAVADAGLDSVQPNTRDISAQVVVPALAEQAEALDSFSFHLHRSDVVRSNDTPAALLRRLGVNDAEAAQFIATDTASRAAAFGRNGRMATAELSDELGLQRLSIRWADSADDSLFKRYVVERKDGRLHSRIESDRLNPSIRLASGQIKTSLYGATDEARVPDSIAGQIADIFSGDIDFHRSLRKGDRFSVIYEVLEADGEVVRPGKVLAAEFVNAGREYRAVWHGSGPGTAGRAGAASPAQGAYYTMDGQSLRRAYLASPLEFSRVSSGFSMRMHPILKQWRAHLGVDYAAPTGTSVRSVGDGVVDFAGRQGGYGNVVIVKHGNQHSTVYAHLSRIDVRVGQSIRQAQQIGAVGATGWATGPHLHFEFRVGGVHQDPLHLAKRSEPAAPIAASERESFDRWASAMRDQLALASLVERATAQ